MFCSFVVLYNMRHETSSPGPLSVLWSINSFLALCAMQYVIFSECYVFFLSSRPLPCVKLVKLYSSRPLTALAGSGLMRTLCCAVCTMKGSGLGTLFYSVCQRRFNCTLKWSFRGVGLRGFEPPPPPPPLCLLTEWAGEYCQQ